MRFEFATAARIVFGPGSVTELGALAAPFGKRAMLVTGKDKIRHAAVIGDLEGAGFTCTLFGIPREPSIAMVREGAELCRAGSCEVVIAIGGGSAIDGAKAIAALAANPRDVMEYLEVIGSGRALDTAPLPVIAVPTTAGTGAEVTRNAVLASPEHGVKVSLRSPAMLPRVALVDPDLTRGLPRRVAAATGLDALTQLIEPWVSSRANPMVDALCRDALPRVATSLARVCADGNDSEARAAMSYASLCGGLALANAGLGVVHGFAGPVGGSFDAPHGEICAAILPQGMRANIDALRRRAPESAALDRYREIAGALTGKADASAEDGVEWVEALVRQLEIPALRKYGISQAHVAALADKAERASSMKANPINLTHAELCGVLEASL